MIILAGMILGIGVGTYTAKSRGGAKLDVLQYGAVYGIAFTLIGGAFFFKSGVGVNVAEISYPRLRELINEGKIVKDKDKPLNLLVEVGRNTQVLAGFYEKDGQPTPFRTTL